MDRAVASSTATALVDIQEAAELVDPGYPDAADSYYSYTPTTAPVSSVCVIHAVVVRRGSGGGLRLALALFLHVCNRLFVCLRRCVAELRRVLVHEKKGKRKESDWKRESRDTGRAVCTYTVKYVLERNPSQASGWKIRSSSIVKSILDSDDIA
eukprot:612698-Prorocentrum_minimum.AAC.2